MSTTSMSANERRHFSWGTFLAEKSTQIDTMWMLLLLIGEAILGIMIIQFVTYTEIDFRAYMQEVEGWWVDGEYDYRKLKGDTGPLVYPAGFLYIYAVIRWLTDEGNNIRIAQYIFLAMYVATQAIVMVLFRRAFAGRSTAFRIASLVICLSKRLHSIFMLRLFNDGVAMLIFYVSCLFFTKQRWNSGCFFFSLAVSVKMNILLFAPGLLLLLLQSSPDIITVCWRLILYCGVPQLILGAPFLARFPLSYLRKAFELDRVFQYQWTVNLKFLPDTVFLSKPLSLFLLGAHLTVLGVMAKRWIRHNALWRPNHNLSAHYILYTLFTSNFIGICFARTLHYQFYSWYFHTLPFLLLSYSYFPIWLALIVQTMIEASFVTFPATGTSSALLQVAHIMILCTLQAPTDAKGHDKQKKR